MSCCQQSRKDFLTTKLGNFKAYLEAHCGTEEEKTALASFASVDAVMPYLLQAVALQRAGKLDEATAALVTHFTKDADAAFHTKVGRYITMFCEVLTS
jgi:hypothetical protein